jgi:periplasmic protein CpxP/Spy
MNRFRSFAAGAVVAAMLATAAGSYAQGALDGRRGGPGGPGGRRGGPELGLPLRQLNLTDAQEQQVKDIRERHRDEARQIGERLRTAAEAQRKAVETSPVNESLIRSTTQELADVQADAAIAQAHVRAEIFGIFTADQKAQLSKMQADRQAQAEQMRQKAQQRLQQRQQQQ